MFERTLPLGRLRGIPIGAHWSLLVIGGLLGLTLATGLLPDAVEASTVAYWVAATLATLAFFASILVHELAHALVARRHGVEVSDITLWILGGLARLRTEPPTARAQLLIAVAGPAMSLTAGLVFGASAVAAELSGLPDVATVSLAWLALVNGVLAVFNMLPGAPLDGGRVLSALLWMRRGDRNAAAVTAAHAGRVVGFVLIGLGLANFLFGVGFGTLWTALIGWFIVAASSAEEQQARVRGAIERLTVADLMDRAPAVLPEWLTVDAALDSIGPQRRVALLQRFDDGDIGGLVTTDMLSAVAPRDRDTTRLVDIGRPKHAIRTLAPDDPASVALDALDAGPFVVLDRSQVVGVVDVVDLLRRRDLTPAG